MFHVPSVFLFVAQPTPDKMRPTPYALRHPSFHHGRGKASRISPTFRNMTLSTESYTFPCRSSP